MLRLVHLAVPNHTGKEGMTGSDKALLPRPYSTREAGVSAAFLENHVDHVTIPKKCQLSF
jgi:hypothetical protein